MALPEPHLVLPHPDTLFQNKNLDWFPRMRAMSLVSGEGEGEQNEIRILQEKLGSTMKLVSHLTAQLNELKEQVCSQASVPCGVGAIEVMGTLLQVETCLPTVLSTAARGLPTTALSKSLTRYRYRETTWGLGLTICHQGRGVAGPFGEDADFHGAVEKKARPPD